MPALNSYTRADGWSYDLVQDKAGAYHVYCYNPEDELHWHVSGVVVTDDGQRQTRRPFTLEEATDEFERWRPK